MITKIRPSHFRGYNQKSQLNTSLRQLRQLLLNKNVIKQAISICAALDPAKLVFEL